MPIKIVHIISRINTGGAERVLVNLIKSSDKRIFRHHVISLSDIGSLGDELLDLDIDVYALGMKWWNSIPFFFRRIKSIVRKISPDVIQGWMYHGNVAAAFADKKIPIVFSIHSSYNKLSNIKGTTKIIAKIGAHFSSKIAGVVYCSKSSCSEHQLMGYDLTKSCVIPNGFDVAAFRPDASARNEVLCRFNIPPDNFVIGHLARFHPVKNQAGLIEACNILAKKHKKFTLLMLGDGLDEGNAVLSELISKYDLNMAICLVGHELDVHKILPAFDSVISSSLSEAFPLVLGEAMACGVPCIATDVGDSAYIIGATGFVVPPNDTNSLADAMIKMATLSSEERNALGIRARQRVAENFTLESTTKAYENLYYKVIEKRKNTI